MKHAHTGGSKLACLALLALLAAGLPACVEQTQPEYPPHSQGEAPGSSSAEAAALGDGLPTYDGHRVYFDEWGRPLIYKGGAWSYVPTTAPGYQDFRKYWLRLNSSERQEATPPGSDPRQVPRRPSGETWSDF
ncbi:MAG: hypothetical protein RBU30_09540 [Polyangia bacterium]|nr:hypothetical protein [Polyangia bacterium]